MHILTKAGQNDTKSDVMLCGSQHKRYDMPHDKETVNVSLDITLETLRNHLKEGLIAENERRAVGDFIKRLEKNHKALRQKFLRPSEPYASYSTEAELMGALTEHTVVRVSPASRTSSSVPAAEYIEEKRPRRKTLYLMVPAFIALAIGTVFNVFHKDHVFARQNADQTYFQGTRATPVIPVHETLEPPPKQTTAVEISPEPDKIFLYRYYVSAGRLRHNQNRLSAIAERFGCDTKQLRIYNKNLFPSESQEFLQKAGYLWIPGDECSYDARAHLHTDYVLSYRVGEDEGPIALGALRRRFGCQKEQLTAYFRKETPGINAEAIPPGTRVALPSTLCSALNR